ncbi:MAG: hypothetical protein WA010_03540 [Sulfuricurvum sp.]
MQFRSSARQRHPLKFGKYKGKTLTEIAEGDKGYLSWMLSNMESLDEDMRYSIQRVIA